MAHALFDTYKSKSFRNGPHLPKSAPIGAVDEVQQNFPYFFVIVIWELERSVYLVSFIYPVHVQDGWSETPCIA